MIEEVFEKLKQQLYNAIDAIKSSGVTITTEKLDSFIDSQLMFVKDITNEDKKSIRLYLESHLFVEHDHDGYVIVDSEDSDWYT